LTEQKVGHVSLHNGGGFVVRMMFRYRDADGNYRESHQGGDITLGFTQKVDPGVLGVPNGSLITLKAFVVWGSDNIAQQEFVYEAGNQTAKYTITGTTLINTLGFIGFEP
jgi:hypothetical protein